jgi:hypothetical protein
MVDQQMQERESRRQQIVRKKDEVLMQQIPEPLVLKNDCACKAICVLSDGKTLLVGLDNGVVKVVDHRQMRVFGEQKLAEGPCLKIC